MLIVGINTIWILKGSIVWQEGAFLNATFGIVEFCWESLTLTFMGPIGVWNKATILLVSTLKTLESGTFGCHHML